jgi:nitronate monooxygenase
MTIVNDITGMLNIRFPMIMAPMFLVSNEMMLKAAMDNGIMGVLPSLNYRKEEELTLILNNLNEYKRTPPIKTGSFGINLIVQKTNPYYEKHLKICVDKKVPFYITSLGNPKEVVEAAHSYGAKVFCDVINLQHAAKAASVNCDGFIAVGQGAGGHAGPYPLHILVPALKRDFPHIPVIAAGGIANGYGIAAAVMAGASGVSIGTRFIASDEAKVSKEYKDAVVNSSMDDIIMSSRISGTPSSIINTPYAKKIGTKQNFIERYLSNHKATKRYFKMLVQLRGMKQLEQAILPGNYNNLWEAGQSVELINDIKPCTEIIKRLIEETEKAIQEFNKSITNYELRCTFVINSQK